MAKIQPEITSSQFLKVLLFNTLVSYLGLRTTTQSRDKSEESLNDKQDRKIKGG